MRLSVESKDKSSIKGRWVKAGVLWFTVVKLSSCIMIGELATGVHIRSKVSLRLYATKLGLALMIECQGRTGLLVVCSLLLYTHPSLIA